MEKNGFKLGFAFFPQSSLYHPLVSQNCRTSSIGSASNIWWYIIYDLASNIRRSYIRSWAQLTALHQNHFSFSTNPNVQKTNQISVLSLTLLHLNAYHQNKSYKMFLKIWKGPNICKTKSPKYHNIQMFTNQFCNQRISALPIHLLTARLNHFSLQCIWANIPI